MSNKSFMYRTLAIFALALLVLGVSPWRAGATDGVRQPQPSMVAIVQPNKILNVLEELTVRIAELDARRNEYRSQLNEISGRVEVLDEKLKTLPDGSKEQADASFELREQMALLEFRSKGLDILLAEDMGGVIKGLYEKIIEATENVASADGYDIVFVDDRDIAFPPGRLAARDVQQVISQRRILYASDSIDITELVIKRMNNDFNALNK